VEGRLWGPALLVARFCGDLAFQETATAMADACLQQGTPLHTLCSSITGPATSEVAPGDRRLHLNVHDSTFQYTVQYIILNFLEGINNGEKLERIEEELEKGEEEERRRLIMTEEFVLFYLG